MCLRHFRILLRILVGYQILVIVPRLTAQPVDPSEAEWEALTSEVNVGDTASAHSSTDAKSREVAMPSPDVGGDTIENPGIARCRLQASRMRAYASKYPGSPHVVEAQHREAVSLFEAAFEGDDRDKERREQLARDLASNQSLPTASRWEVAAYSRNLEVHRRVDLDPEQRLDEFERVARGLAREFPEIGKNYESLLQIAKCRTGGGGLQLARELTTMPASPEIRLQAADQAARCALVGKSLLDICEGSIGAWDVPRDFKGPFVIIYTWSEAMPWSVEVAAQIVALAPKRTVVLGLNLDADAQSAREFAERTPIPGAQAYSAAGNGGAVFKMLHLTEPGLVYVTDGDGVVLSISASDALVRFSEGRANR